LNWPDYARTARAKLKRVREGEHDELGTCSLVITHMGGFGLRTAVPVVSPPAAATLCVGAVYQQPVPAEGGRGFAFPAWDAPPLEELPWFLLMGAAAGVAASIYATVVRRLGKARPGGKWSPLAAGAALALASVWFPRLLGGGYEAMEEMWRIPPDAGEAAAYLGGKALLTALCIAAGWVGGHFGPSLSMGVALGFVVLAMQGGEGSALPIAGGAALAAAVTHAPMALLVLVYEATSAPASFL
ncbi:chloride channel protein, partial [bacterium]|nr:chloride channel protein [bacterium]